MSKTVYTTQSYSLTYIERSYFMKRLSLFIFFTLLSWSFMQETKAIMPHTVIVVLTAKKEHIEDVKQGLQSVVTPSRNETTNLKYHLVQDKNRPEVFALYEIWTSAEDHAKQFEKPYILQLMQQLEGKLEKPYEACLGSEINPS